MTAGGNFIPSDILIDDVTALGFTETERTRVFYIEGVQLPERDDDAGEESPDRYFAPISVMVTTADGAPVGGDLVNVAVVANTIVIGVDGTGSAKWLAKKDAAGNLVNERTQPDGTTRWNSHVRNLVADSEPLAMTIYRPGPAQDGGGDSGDIFRAVRDDAEQKIKDAGGGTTIALVGWSRGAMIAAGLANSLSNPPAGALGREVVFVGMYDPVDMAFAVDDKWAKIDAKVKAVTIVGPTGPESSRPNEPSNNWDYRTLFPRMAHQSKFQWQVAHAGNVNIVRIFYNASHGSIGGTPGYHKANLDPPDGQYDYTKDVENSIRADRDVRAGMRTAGIDVPDHPDAWYAFPDVRPPKALWQ